MSYSFDCPDCLNKLAKGDNQCSCGWTKPIIKNINRFQCQYIENQFRCEKEGVISHQIRASIWYCWEHRDMKIHGE